MISMQIQGGAQLARTLRELSLKAEQKTMRGILRDSAEPIRAEAERLAPKSLDAPHIKDNIVISLATKDAEGERLEADQHAVAVGPNKDAFYGFFQEFGTVHHAAQPFMRPAFDLKVREALKAVQEGIWRVLRAEGRAQSTTGRGL